MRCPFAGPSLEYTRHKLVIATSSISITARARLVKMFESGDFCFLEHQNLRINLQKGFSFWRIKRAFVHWWEVRDSRCCDRILSRWRTSTPATTSSCFCSGGLPSCLVCAAVRRCSLPLSGPMTRLKSAILITSYRSLALTQEWGGCGYSSTACPFPFPGMSSEDGLHHHVWGLNKTLQVSLCRPRPSFCQSCFYCVFPTVDVCIWISVLSCLPLLLQ